MKKILVGLLLILSLSSFKKKKEHLAFNKGAVTATAATGYPNILKWVDLDGKSVGPFMAAGNYQVSRRFSLGVQYTYQYISTRVHTNTLFTEIGNMAVPIATYQYWRKITYQSLMVTVDYCYLNKGRLCLSSGIGLGYAPRPIIKQYFSDNVDHTADLNDAFTTAMPVVRLRLLFASVKITQRFGVCGGLGLGTDGVISMGAHYTFTDRESK